jgi:lysozyme family protein
MHTFQASDDPEIFRQVKQFYFDEFWKKAGCEYLGEFSAIEQFDTAVNCGVGTAVRHLQEILNAMNGNQKRWPDIPTDGKFGASTIAALRLFLSHNWVSSVGRVNSDLFMEKLINHKQAQRYFAIMANKPDQERFALSWMVRT